MEKKKDLTTGAIFPTITLFAIPMFLGNLMQQLYNIVDTWIVGRYIGKDALASVGAIFALMVFLTSVLLGLCMGSGVVFSRDFGEEAWEKLEQHVSTAFIGIAVVVLMITGLALCGMTHVIRWMQIPIEVQSLAQQYLQIILYGIPAVFLYNFFAGYLKAVGKSMIPLSILALSTALNIGLDILFVLKLGYGIAGAAWATVIAQYLSGLLAFLYCMCRDVHMRHAFRHPKIRSADVKMLANYSVMTCLQQSVMNLGILMVQGIVNSFGVTVMAAFSAGVKIDAFAYMPAQEYGNAFSTFLAQNIGKGKQDRVTKGIRIGLLTTAVYCLLASIVLCSLAEPLLQLFVNQGEGEVIAIGVQYLHIEGACYVGIGILFLWYGLFRAIGRPEFSFVLTVISLGTRVLLAKIASVTSIGVVGIWWAIPIGWLLADMTGWLELLRTRRRME